VWQGIQCTPTPVNGYHYVIAMDMQERQMKGQIPASFFNLTELRGFSLASNFLSGTLPSTVSQLKFCTVLDISNNALTGTIPEALGRLESAKALYFYNNNLNGTLPAVLGDLKTLQVMKFTLNKITGTIPSSLGYLNSLTLLYLGRNQLHGTIPPSLGYLSNVTAFNFYENELSGTIPSSLANLANVSSMELDGNKFSGSIPVFLGNLSTLVLLYLDDNKFTGTIPGELGMLDLLQDLHLHNNLLSGTIPAALGGMKSLLSLDLTINKLHGSISEALGALSKLEILLMTENFLTGRIPDALGSVESLQALELSANYLTGTLPATLGTLTNLTNLYLFTNHLHSTIPPELGGMTRLSTLYLYGNHLYGTLPEALSNLAELNSFFLEDNIFSGRLDGVFNGTRQKYLSLIQLSNNQLTGPLPESLFALPLLKTLVLVSNCFSSVVPSSICDCTALITLSLDGLHSAPSCQRVILPGLFDSYVQTTKVHCGIPRCLFEMPNLNTLHLSGNDLTGPLPENVNISEKLIDLALSHNKLTGTIPREYQSRIWSNLDLSYNKFGGTLATDFGTMGGNFTFQHAFAGAAQRNLTRVLNFTAASLSLRNNRLSDRIPSTILDMTNISVLAGNLFDCDLSGQDLPADDSGKATYQCGSTSFNISYYLWLAAILIIMFVGCVSYYGGWTLERYWSDVATAISFIKLWRNIVTMDDEGVTGNESRLHHYKYVIKVSEEICHVSVRSTVFILVVMLPVYAAISQYYGTHTYEYAWSVSAAFLTGYDALSLLLVCFIVLLGILLVLFWYAFRALRHSLRELPQELEKERADGEESDSKCSWYEKATINIAYFLINFTVVMGVNIAYVYVVIYEDSKYFTAAQIALSIFKLGWTSFSTYLIRWTHHQVVPLSVGDWSSRGVGFFGIQLFVQLFNYVVVPCLVVAAISPDCFINAVVASPTVTSTFYFQQCYAYSAYLGCLLPVVRTATTSYSPPFTYSYQCSSSFITNYAPAFVVMCILSGIVLPLAQVVLQRLHNRATKGTRWFALLDSVLPQILKPLPSTAPEQSVGTSRGLYFDANRHLITLLIYLTLLLTFGAVFPPLAACFLMKILSMTGFARLSIGRFLYNAREEGLSWCAVALEEDCSRVGGIILLRRAACLVIAFSGLFYMLFLFDTLGDAEGLGGAYWVLIVMPLLVLCGAALALYFPVEVDFSGGEMQATEQQQEREQERMPKDVELSTVSPLAALSGRDEADVTRSDP
jgi:Leucine-rich repeat (LRR) protein